MPSSANKIKLGELLIDAGIITSGDLTEAIQVSRRLGVPIGQALLVSRCVTDSVLEAALEAQPLVKDGTLTRSAAVEALRKSVEAGATLRDVLDVNEIGTGEDTQQTSKRLAELLLDSEIVNQDQVDQALMTSFSSGMPLGSALVLEGVLSPSLFPSILRIQRNIREGKVGREQGIDELRSTFLHWIKAEESLARQAEMEDSPELYSQEEMEEAIQSFAVPESESAAPPPAPVPAKPREKVVIDEPGEVAATANPRLYDLLRDAGAIKQSDLQTAFNKVLDDPVASGKMFVLLGLADDKVVKTALKSHAKIVQNSLSEEKAVDAIKDRNAALKTIETHDNGTSTDDLVDDEYERQKREDARAKRKVTTQRVLGGIAVGAAVAGISSLLRKPKR